MMIVWRQMLVVNHEYGDFGIDVDGDRGGDSGR